MMDLRRLRLLKELKHRGTITAVAAALSYSPSAISQQLGLLEKEVGTPLLERVGRGVRLTQAAEILVARTEAILEQIELAEADIAASTSNPSGTIRVASFQSAAMALLPATLEHLAVAHPALQVHVTQMEPEESLPGLAAGEVDVAIAERYPGQSRPFPPALDAMELANDTLRVALPDGWSRSTTRLSLPALESMPWVMEPQGTTARRWATDMCRSAGFEPDVRFQSSDLLLHIRLVETGQAVALLPDLVWGGGRPSVDVRPLPRGARRQILTVVRRGAGEDPRVKALRQHLAQAAHGLSRRRPGVRGRPTTSGQS